MTDEHWGYILLAYGVTAIVILGLLARIVLDYRRLRADLSRLERRGADKPNEIS